MRKICKYFHFCHKLSKWGCTFVARKYIYENMRKNNVNKLANSKNIVYLCVYKKSETRKPRFKCFHNGIILIVSSIKFYGAKVNTFFEITKQNLIKFLIKEITL